MTWFSPSQLLGQQRPPFRLAASPHLHSLIALLLGHHDRRRLLLQIHAQLVAHQAFDQSPAPWHALLKAYSHGPFPQEALHLFRHARRYLADDTFAFAFALKACAGLGWRRSGAQLHGLVITKGFEFHAYVHTSLVNADAEQARKLVDERKTVKVPGLALVGEIR
ncbi:pentatricopeptide repeat-containing protein [Panicum miliaceum]|uniref:Pentatricopeptide repeat-containing protein n=1 Tax=Panicum miliaceum TaxID=4540 RepID=A0A3L6SKF4_PANMI|nr:pentatricopeptide repeat-containing protein [Panicum miliaceum]